jgi:lipid-A-disaccharide synthase
MTAAGADLLYPLCQLSVMWFARVLMNAPLFLHLLSRADRYFRHHRPDAVVLIDYPGFHWWLARRAHFHRIPVFYFVPPQLWAWAGWRVKKMRRFVDHVLCSLPFEPGWYRDRGVEAHYVGHPYFDEMPQQVLDPSFVDSQRGQGGTIVGILPGSRTQELDRNLSTLVRAASRIHQARPDTRFLAACYQPAHRDQVIRYLQRHPGTPIDAHVGRTAEIIQLAHSCLAVSGSVGLEMLLREKPAVVVYRVGRLDMWVGRMLMTAPYISLVNLLAERELYPEFLTVRCQSQAMAEHVLRWLNDGEAYKQIGAELANLKRQVAVPGACGRTAQFILDTLAARRRRVA